MRIIFMGTPEFAVASLKALVEEKWNVVAVVTATDKKAGRGNKIIQSAVKTYALSQEIPVLQPSNLKSPEFLEELQSYQADLQVVVAFRMLPRVVWDMPPKGTFNLHASLLPDYRGAAPINWAIINGETETGITTFLLKHEIDTGDILFQEKEAILPEDNVGSLYQRLMVKGGGLVLKTTQALAEGNYELLPQDFDGNYPKAPKIHRETCEIHWEKTAVEIHNLIRGLSPVPAAWGLIGGKKFKIYKSSLELKHPLPQDENSYQVGDVYSDQKKFIYIKTSDHWIALETLQAEGKKTLDVKAFLSGNQI